MTTTPRPPADAPPGTVSATASLSERLRAVWHHAADEGDLMPGESALAEQLGVSRPALREALVRLAAEGLIDRRQGASTVVNRAALEMPIRLDRQTPFEIALERAGYATEMQLLESGRLALDSDQAAQLRRPCGATALRTVKRWRADGLVAMVAVDILPIPDEVDADGVDPHPSVFASTVELYGEGAVWEPAWPKPCIVDQQLGAWLELAEGTPVLALDLVGISRSGLRCYLATEYHVPGTVPQGLIRCLVN